MKFEGSDRGQLKVLSDNLPGVTEENYKIYLEISISPGLDLSTRLPKFESHHLSAAFENELLSEQRAKVQQLFNRPYTSARTYKALCRKT